MPFYDHSVRTGFKPKPELEFQGFISFPPDPFFSDIVFYSKFEGADGDTSAIDESPNNLSIEFNNGASISTSQFKLGSSSCLFDANNLQYLRVLHSFDFSGDFTVEAWVYLNSLLSSSINFKNVICELNPGQVLSFGSSSNILRFQANSIIESSYTPNVSQWIHIALVRSSGTNKLFADGVEVASASDTVDFSTSEINIGRHRNAGGGISRHFDGFIDSFRVTQAARYTSDFDPDNDTYMV